MTIHEHEARRLIAEGADPRRAGAAAAEYFGLPRNMHAREGLVIGIILGSLMTIVVTVMTLGVFDLRPAPSGSIRIASEVRSAVPDADDLSGPDLIARLKAPQQTAITSGPVGSQSDLDQIRTAFSSIPEADRPAALENLVSFIVLLHDPSLFTCVRAVRTLSDQQRSALAQDERLTAVLAWIASLSVSQQNALLTTNLAPVLNDANLFGLLQTLPTLDPLAAKALTLLKTGTYRQRETLINVLASLDPDDGRFERLIAAFRFAAPSLNRLLDGRLLNCAFDNREACR